MTRKVLFQSVALIAGLLAAACSGPATSLVPSAQPTTNLPNPASVHCEANGGRLEIKQDETGGQFGVCVFVDGTECEEWAYYRGVCQPGSAAGTPQAADTVAADGCNLYRNAQLGYSLHYPPDASVNVTDDPLQSLSITGPLIDGDYWPAIYLAHPADREEYRPPEGVELDTWLVEHALLPPEGQQPATEVRQSDVQIAGTTAIHTRFARSPQSFAYDKYFFARAGQLYSVVILHTGDKEDWDLYNHFLESIQFAE